MEYDRKNPWWAGFLNFFFWGAGYIILGKKTRFGIILLVARVLWLAAGVLSSSLVPTEGLGSWLASLAVFVFSLALAYDAYELAREAVPTEEYDQVRTSVMDRIYGANQGTGIYLFLGAFYVIIMLLGIGSMFTAPSSNPTSYEPAGDMAFGLARVVLWAVVIVVVMFFFALRISPNFSQPSSEEGLKKRTRDGRLYTVLTVPPLLLWFSVLTTPNYGLFNACAVVAMVATGIGGALMIVGFVRVDK